MSKPEQQLISYLKTISTNSEIKMTYKDFKSEIDNKLVVTSTFIYEKLFLDFNDGKKYLKKLGFNFIEIEENHFENKDNCTVQVEKEFEEDPIKKLLSMIEGKDFSKTDSSSVFNDEEFQKNLEAHEVISFQNNEQYFTEYNEDHDKETLEKIVISNIGLVEKWAHRYYKSMPKGALDYEDLKSIGLQGLLKAIERYDVSKGYKFSTYASWWIRQAITRGIADYSRTIRLPVHVHEDLHTIRTISNKESFESSLDMVKQIVEKTGFKEEKVTNLLIYDYLYNQNLVSLSTSIGEDEDTEIGSFVETPILVNQTIYGDNVVLNEIFQKELNIQIMNLLKSILTERQLEVIILRFGLISGEIMTLEEIGKIQGVTRERIRQIEAKALNKLSNPKYLKMFNDYWER